MDRPQRKGESLMDIQINLSKDTIIENLNGVQLTVSQLRAGNQVQIYHSLAMTRSLPPQSAGFKIIVDTDIK